MQAGYQGEPGAYSEEAVLVCFGREAKAQPFPTLDATFDALAHGKVERIVVPVENSQAGSINRTYDLLRSHDLFVVGETVLQVDHCLLALPGQKLSDIRRVHSHPQAIEQCDEFLRKLGCQIIAHYDTAGAAKMISHEARVGEAAIAGRRAAEFYKLDVLADRIQTVADNRTRFLVVSRNPETRREGPQKTALILATDHQPGALHRVLGVLAKRDINLLNLESRPSRGRPFEYVFYLDFEGHRDDAKVREALAELGSCTAFLRVLGSFPRSA